MRGAPHQMMYAFRQLRSLVAVLLTYVRSCILYLLTHVPNVSRSISLNISSAAMSNTSTGASCLQAFNAARSFE